MTKNYDLFERINKISIEINDIWKEEEKLMKRFVNRTITKRELLIKEKEINDRTLAIGRLYDSAEELRQGLMSEVGFGRLPKKLIDEIVVHEMEHAELAKPFGLDSKFIHVTPGYFFGVCTWYYNFSQVSKYWNLNQIEKFVSITLNVKNPSNRDSLYKNFLSKKKI